MAGSIHPKYVVPNLVTLAGLSFGLVAILRCLEGDFGSACWWIVLCVLTDKLDGFAARRLDAQSNFGVQMDSLSDLVTFCVAPAVLLLAVSRATAAPAWGAWSTWLPPAAAILFVAAGALRLARFNVCTAEADPLNFQGFPTTFCGGVLATAYLVAARHGALQWWLQAAPLAYAALALLMVSNVPVPKFRRAKNPLLNVVILTNLLGAYAVGILRVVPEYLLVLVLVYLVFGGGSVWVGRLKGRTSAAS